MRLAMDTLVEGSLLFRPFPPFPPPNHAVQTCAASKDCFSFNSSKGPAWVWGLAVTSRPSGGLPDFGQFKYSA